MYYEEYGFTIKYRLLFSGYLLVDVLRKLIILKKLILKLRIFLNL
jgi:hypothetical protein